MSDKKAIALGVFDGLHLGHMAVISAATDCRKYGFSPCVLLFDVHPMSFLSDTPPKELMTPEHKSEYIKSLGATPVTLPFAEISGMSPEDFFDKILLNKLNAAALCCGYNYHFGRGGKGDAALLRRLCDERGIMLFTSEEIDCCGGAVSSTRIRALLEAGDIITANKLLGREFSYKLPVVSGDGRGHTMNSPTINQYFPVGHVVPKHGVYVSRATVEGKKLLSVTNIGERPTFDAVDLRSETYIIGFNGNLYNKEVEISLVKYLRPAKKFQDKQALADQIKSDIQAATSSENTL